MKLEAERKDRRSSMTEEERAADTHPEASRTVEMHELLAEAAVKRKSAAEAKAEAEAKRKSAAEAKAKSKAEARAAKRPSASRRQRPRPRRRQRTRPSASRRQRPRPRRRQRRRPSARRMPRPVTRGLRWHTTRRWRRCIPAGGAYWRQGRRGQSRKGRVRAEWW